jgi:peptidoglycan hydrolase-like protein with peptidoglycan-binding domain
LYSEKQLLKRRTIPMSDDTAALEQNESLTAEDLSTDVENVVEAPAEPEGPRSVQFGDEGESVEEIQFLLGTWGKLHEDYHTGKFCATTRDAVKAFQEGQGYVPTGEVDEKTLVALKGERDKAEVTAEEDTPAA